MRRVSPVTIVLSIAVIAAAVFLSLSGWKETKRSRGIESEVSRLREEADRIRRENRSLSDQIAFFSSETFEEREAKEKLGMRRSDEEVVAIDVEPFPSSDAVAGVSVSGSGSVTLPEEPNYRKWLVLFGFLGTAES